MEFVLVPPLIFKHTDLSARVLYARTCLCVRPRQRRAHRAAVSAAAAAPVDEEHH